MKRLAAGCLAMLLAVPSAQGGPVGRPVVRPVVLELFTSQSCSSCPPADALLAALAQTQPDILALEFHVDYWNYLTWRDLFSSAAATARQRAYAAALGTEVYTPELIIDGRRAEIGSDRARVQAGIAAARTALARAPDLALTARLQDGRAAIDVGAGGGDGHVLIAGYDAQHVTAIGGGENGGRVLTNTHVVRGWRDLGAWHGAALHMLADLPPGEQAAVLVQDADGKVLAAARVAP